ncbi:MAG: sensor histidine kinase [Ramlibacter sp.]
MRRPQPSLQLRTVGSVLLAFVVVFAVLLGYLYWQYWQIMASNTSGLKRYGDALLQSLQALPEDHARSTLAATAQWTNVRRAQVGRFPGTILYTLRTADGRELLATPALRNVELGTGPGMRPLEIGGTPYRVYEAHSPRYRLQVVEPWRTTGQFLRGNAGEILPYLLLALPCVVVPVWLSARNGLRPLQQLADGIAQRSPDDLRPVGMRVRHRELKPLAQALDSLFVRLRGKIERERAFVQDAAHELRTPLAVVSAQADVLARSPDPHQRAVAHAQLTQAIARASHLARQLLVLASLDEMRAPALARIDVAQAVRRLLAQAEPAALARGMELSLDAPDALWCEVDERALESIVTNLVDNAVRYGRAGGCIVVRLEVQAGELRLEVRDDGPGIAAAEQGRVFERFWRGAGHDTPGSGLGLAIVRQAALRMQGTAMLAEGIGAAGVGFVVRVPLP